MRPTRKEVRLTNEPDRKRESGTAGREGIRAQKEGRVQARSLAHGILDSVVGKLIDLGGLDAPLDLALVRNGFSRRRVDPTQKKTSGTSRSVNAYGDAARPEGCSDRAGTYILARTGAYSGDQRTMQILDLVTVGVSFHEKSVMMKRQSLSGRSLTNSFHSPSGSPADAGKVLSTLTSVISALILRTMMEYSRLDKDWKASTHFSATAIPDAMSAGTAGQVGGRGAGGGRQGCTWNKTGGTTTNYRACTFAQECAR